MCLISRKSIGRISVSLIMIFAFGFCLRPIKNSNFRISHSSNFRKYFQKVATVNPGTRLAMSSQKFLHNIPLQDQDGSIRKMICLDTGSNTNQATIILSGTAQTVSTWSPHIRFFSNFERTIIPELRCQGIHTELKPEYASIEQHLIDLHSLLLHLQIVRVNLVGFSFGGRLGIAFAAHYPHLVKRLSVTGVPLHRPRLGAAILKSWREGLHAGSMRECAWSFILNGYSGDFISKYYGRLPDFVNMVCETNDASRLYNLMNSCHIEDEIEDQFSVIECIQKTNCPIQIIGADLDRIAGNKEVQDMHHMISSKSELVMFENCGHLIPFERPIEWRKSVLDFLKG